MQVGTSMPRKYIGTFSVMEEAMEPQEGEELDFEPSAAEATGSTTVEDKQVC
jgi:hypothetical protein